MLYLQYFYASDISLQRKDIYIYKKDKLKGKQNRSLGGGGGGGEGGGGVIGETNII